jgi:hypothetical protein
MNLWRNHRFVICVFVIAAVIASIGKYRGAPQPNWAGTYTQYNNYVIFRTAGRHLATGDNLYDKWIADQWDQFKYSPTFAAAMWPFAQLPDVVGLCLWNALNAAALAWAIRSLPIAPHLSAIAAWIVFKDQFTSAQNAQSNGLVAGLMILTLVYWERGWLGRAALAVASSIYIKLFGVAVLLLWPAWPGKKKSLVWLAVAMLGLAAAPLLVTSYGNLIDQYRNWLAILEEEYPASEGISVMGILHVWFGMTGHKGATLLVGAVILAAPLLRFDQYVSQLYRLRLLASTLIWVVLFNHRAESATFVIATTGVAIWFVSSSMSRWNVGLVAATIVLSGFSSSDIMPQWVQQHLLEPYHVKALPSLIVWLQLQVEMWRAPRPANPLVLPMPLPAPQLLRQAA